MYFFALDLYIVSVLYSLKSNDLCFRGFDRQTIQNGIVQPMRTLWVAGIYTTKSDTAFEDSPSMQFSCFPQYLWILEGKRFALGR